MRPSTGCTIVTMKPLLFGFTFTLISCSVSDTSIAFTSSRLKVHSGRSRPFLSSPLLALRGGGNDLLERLNVDVYGEPITEQKVEAEIDSSSLNSEYNLTFLASTAGSIAAYRAAVTFLNSSYVDDPFAIMFAREISPDKLTAAKLKNSSELARFAIRTRYFDTFLRDAVFKAGIRQVWTPESKL